MEYGWCDVDAVNIGRWKKNFWCKQVLKAKDGLCTKGMLVEIEFSSATLICV